MPPRLSISPPAASLGNKCFDWSCDRSRSVGRACWRFAKLWRSSVPLPSCPKLHFAILCSHCSASKHSKKGAFDIGDVGRMSGQSAVSKVHADQQGSTNTVWNGRLRPDTGVSFDHWSHPLCDPKFLVLLELCPLYCRPVAPSSPPSPCWRRAALPPPR